MKPRKKTTEQQKKFHEAMKLLGFSGGYLWTYEGSNTSNLVDWHTFTIALSKGIQAPDVVDNIYMEAFNAGFQAAQKKIQSALGLHKE